MKNKRASKKQQALIDKMLSSVYWGRGCYPVRTRQAGEWNTLNQWAAVGRFVFIGQPAVEMWASQSCKGAYYYYEESQTAEDWERLAQLLGKKGLTAIMKSEKRKLEQLEWDTDCKKRYLQNETERGRLDQRILRGIERELQGMQKQLRLLQLNIILMQALIDKESTPADTAEEYTSRTCIDRPPTA